MLYRTCIYARMAIPICCRPRFGFCIRANDYHLVRPIRTFLFSNAFQIRAVKVEKSWNTSHHEYGHGHTRNNREKKITSNIKFLYFLCHVYAFRFISWEWFIITLSHFLMVVLLSLACLTNRVIIKLMTKILDKFYNKAFCINFWLFFFFWHFFFRLTTWFSQNVKIAT